MTSRTSRRLAALLATLAAAAALGGCAPLLLGGAVVGGSMMAIDRRTSGAQIDDQTIEVKGIKRVNDSIGDRGSVSVTSYNHIVLLTGTVTNEADKAAVERAVGAIESVRSVVNEVAIGTAASFGNRSSDTLVTSKVKASFVDAKDLQVNAFKVVTERGVVYLMGRVTEREANRAADIARGVSGVAKVVKVFEIVTEAELADLQTKPAKP
ncbi:MAG TPA: BON domain-containing protein [Burkholderiaceae bacterium]|nr:BON domain-containing protein [Burkholderiaceae bacterium]